MDHVTTLNQRIETRTARLAIVGQGYVGLPVAVEFAATGFSVTGLDTDPDRVAALSFGRSCSPDVTNTDLMALLREGRYQATTDFGVLERSDVVIICVPTPLRKSKDPDIACVVAAGEAVTDAAATKPFGFMPFYPGPGIGGHCIPVDPLYLSWKMRLNGYEARFIALADDINRAMPGHVVTVVIEVLNDIGRPLKGARILVLGVAYKRGVGDTRESPAHEIISMLLRRGADVAYADPHVPTFQIEGTELKAVDLTDEIVRQADCTLILTDHREFDFRRIVELAPLVVDTRNATWGISAAGRVIRF